MKPYYESPDVTLYHGKAEAFEFEFESDLVFTDPPAEYLQPRRTAWAYGVKIAAFTVAPYYLPLIPKRLGDLTYRGALAAGVGRDFIPCLVYTVDDVMFLPYETWQTFDESGWGSTDHPAQKPLAAIEWFLQQLPGEVVLDPFAGTGTTLLAARNLGRKAVGIEVEEKWCEVAAKRLSEVPSWR